MNNIRVCFAALMVLVMCMVAACDLSGFTNSQPAATTSVVKPVCNDEVPSGAKIVMEVTYVTKPNSLEGKHPAHKVATDHYQASRQDSSVQVRLRPNWSGSAKGWELSNLGSKPVIIQTFNCTKRVEPNKQFPELFDTEPMVVEVYLAS